MRVELTWQSSEPRIWAGELCISGDAELRPEPGRLSEPANLTPGMLMTGGIYLTPENDSLKFAPSSTIGQLRNRDGRFVPAESRRGGVAFRVRGKGAERLVLALRRDGSNDLVAPVAIALQDLASGQPITSQFNATATWTVQRAVGDQLRVALTPVTTEPSAVSANAVPTSLFWNDEKARVSLVTDAASGPTADAYELVCDTLASGNLALATQTWTLERGPGENQFNALDAYWQPPNTEGSYRLRWRLQKKATVRSVMGMSMPLNLTDSFTHPMTLIRGSGDERVIAESFADVVVLSRQPAFANASSAFSQNEETLASLGRLEPFGRSWSVSRLVPLRQVTQFASSVPIPVQAKKVTVAGKQLAELPPGAHWSHALPTSKVGTRHRLKLTIPEGKSMRIGVCVIDQLPSKGKNVVIRDVTSIRTRLVNGGSEWATIEVDYYPISGSPQLAIINRDPTQTLQFEAVDVFAMTRREDVASSPAKSLGNIGQVANIEPIDDGPWAVQQSSGAAMPSVPFNAASRRALMHFDGEQWLRMFGDVQSIDAPSARTRFDLYSAAIRMVEAVKREGYRGVVMTVCEDGRSLFPTSCMTAARDSIENPPLDSKGNTQSLECLLRLFDREGLVLIPCVRPNFPMTKLERAIAAGSIGRGIALTAAWNSLGIDLSLNEFEACCTGIYNPTHDQVAEQVVALVDELSQQCQGHACVDTIGVLGDEGSCLNMPAKREMLDAGSLDRFHASLPAGAPARSQMMAWVAEDGESAFDQWRAACLRSLYVQLSVSVGRQRHSLMALSTRDQLPIDRLSSGAGSPILYTRLYRKSPLETLAARCRDEQSTTASPSSVGLPSPELQPESWLSAALHLTPTPKLGIDLGYSDAASLFSLEMPKPSSELKLDSLQNSLNFIKLLYRSDRSCIAISGNAAIFGDAVTRRSLARFNALPPVLMEEVPPADEAMKLARVRRASFGGATSLVATNHSRWPMTVSVMIAASSPVEPIVNGDVVPTIDTAGAWVAKLAPGELAAVRIQDPNAKVRAWTASIDGGAAQVASIGKSVRELADAVAMTTEPKSCDCIENASFEAEVSGAAVDAPASGAAVAASGATQEQLVVGNQSQVAGWLLAQHPVGCAALDTEVAHHGKRSIRLSNREGRPGGTWVVSRPIPSPASERLAVSLVLRGQPSEDPAKSDPILVRVAIEGNVSGSAMRQAQIFRVPRDGKWSQTPCRVEVESLPRCGVESLRLAIDVMNEGTVWIDSVRAEDSFMTETEKSQLQSQMFLALGGIAKGELSHAAKLLESHWVQQMLGGVAEPPRPAIVSTDETLDTSVSSGNKETTESSNPGIAERLKGWIPRPIRF